MKKFIKSLISISCLGLVLVAMTSCGKDSDPTNSSPVPSQSSTPSAVDTTPVLPSTSGSQGVSTTPGVDVEKKEYKIKAECLNGKPIKDAEIIIKGKGVEETAYTDKDGIVTFSLKEQAYTIYPAELPGYTVQEEYNGVLYDTNEEVNVVKYDPSLIEEEMPEGTSYVQGDVMYDYTFKGLDFKSGTAVDNQSLTLSELLKEKEIVVLNFWYTTCSWCVREFPSLISAYADYQDKVQLIGINYQDSADSITSFGKDYSFNFFTTYGDVNLVQSFMIGAFPTTIIIDRYGLASYIHSGGIDSVDTWKGLFDQYCAEDYVPTYIPTDDNGNIDWQAPDATNGPKYPGQEAISNAALASGVEAEFTDGIEVEGYTANWPWIVSSNTDGKPAICPSNNKVDYSYSLLSFNITVPANKVLAFDYVSSCETNDVLGVFVGLTKITEISGKSSDTCYVYAAGSDSEQITINLLYRKDSTLSQFDDTVYVNNIRFVEIKDVPTSMYIIRQAATGNLNKFTGHYENYITPVFNENDGYYHVNKVDGPLLFAALLDQNTRFSNTSIVEYSVSTESDLFSDEVDKIIIKYAQYAVNSVFQIYGNIPTEGLTPITKELYGALLEVANSIGEAKKDKEKELLQMCVYLDQYVKGDDEEIKDPIAGLAPFNAFEAKLGKNEVEYKYSFVPRGYKFKFTPEKSGAYLIQSLGDAEAMLFLSEDGYTMTDEGSKPRDYYYTLANSQFGDPFYHYTYWQAGKTYYFAPTFWAVEQTGVLEFEIKYLGETEEYLTSCSEPAFTSSDSNMEDIISLSYVDVKLGTDGYYHPLDAEGNIILEEYIYADFTMINGVFSYSSLSTLLEKGAFDFTKDENGNPVKGTNMTDVAQKYLDLCSTDINSIFYGTVKVNFELQELLQKLMDKYTFADVENSWLKLCYYVVHLGA